MLRAAADEMVAAAEALPGIGAAWLHRHPAVGQTKQPGEQFSPKHSTKFSAFSC